MYDIGFQRYRDYKFRVCDKDSIPLKMATDRDKTFKINVD